ncbi:MAG: Asp-tRNA(Asn)/Glu-tRNA(Gln) amidotransferase subunit GatA [Chloroflexi bacterium]|nr:MAG: Asp-tRNA(Asn)/Glu-tRNA(Gln) amidotransferase subunit GatA [Chloroflexota bacterium]
MTSDDLTRLTITEASRLLRLGSISSADLVTAHVERIERLDKHVKAYLRFTPELWEKQAEEADRRIRQGDAPALAGIPLAVKDVLCVRGVETTAGSQILRGFKPPYTGTAVGRLFEAGAVMLGVTNCDEFAMGSSTENSGYFPTRNPWDLQRVPGGSSGGSAAAVASGQAMIALGTDTGGSIRQPAALCGVVGMKPTYGRVSRYGLIAFASSLDQIGPFARSVDDAAIVLSLMSGLDPLDATSSDRPGMEVLNGISEIDAPNITEKYLQTRRNGFGTEVRRRVMLGTYALSSGYYDAYYLKAQKVRTLIKRDFDQAFQKCDAIVSATSPTVAFPIGAKTQDPLSMYLCDVLTLGGNLAGLPGISVPCGTADGLPVGLQVLGPQWGENVVLRVARAYEEASEMKAEVAGVV